jgi:hypothetical protein
MCPIEESLASTLVWLLQFVVVVVAVVVLTKTDAFVVVVEIVLTKTDAFVVVVEIVLKKTDALPVHSLESSTKSILAVWSVS